MSDPLVSILIPCHNAAPWVADAVASALAQTWMRLEAIVVDDGSTDASAEVVRKITDRRVRLITQGQRGAAAARNTAWRAAQGDFLQFLDADDLLAPDKITVQLTRLQAVAPGGVACGAWGRFEAEPAAAEFRPERVWTDAAPLEWLVLSWGGGGMMHPAAWLTPRPVAERAGLWNETLSLDDDGEFFCRVLLASSGVWFCPAARSYYRRHQGGSLSGAKSPTAWRSSHDVCWLVQAASLAREDSPRVRHACALNHLRFAFRAWPYARGLAEISAAEAKRLDRAARMPAAGPRFNLVARLLGWRLARTLQHRLDSSFL